MKKFVLGLLVGVSITVAGSAYADDIVDSIVGKTIQGQFPVKISGKSLDTQAAVIDGTSYLPVRAIGEALNMDVKFDADMGIELNPKGATTVPETPQPTSTPTQPTTDGDELVDPSLTTEQKIEFLNNEIKDMQWSVTIWKDELIRVTGMTPERKSNTEKQIISNEARITAMKALLEQLQK